MLLEEQHRLSLSFAENVALLSLLRRAPTAPQANPRTSSADRDQGRVLSFEREASLTNTFAFLSGISDDPAHVVATCVEELPRGHGIRVVVAINKVGPDRGNTVLARIKKGLEEIFSHLSRPNNGMPPNQMSRPFHAHIAAFRGRCRCRCQSRPGINEFEKGAEVLVDRLTVLEACQQTDVILHMKRVLRAAYRLSRTTDLGSIFAELTTSGLEPGTKAGVATRLNKLAQYRESCLYLLRTAKKFALFDNAEVVCVSLDPHLFSRNLTTSPKSCLASCLSRCQTGTRTDLGHKRIQARLKTDDSHFKSTVRKVLTESRVHAEVQIVCYYELQPVSKTPRVICSSKDACYLCNLFIQLHGTFHIPKTHGNLYPRWQLLPISTLNHVLARINKCLETQIREIIGDIMANPGSKLMLSANENESTVFPFSTSLSALASSV
ncbi:hypothetical protein BT67DRAFT_425741, partial [Trichocladium antarcticum]